MPRKPMPRRNPENRTWFAQVGVRSERTGRQGRVTLRYEDGTPVRWDDQAGAHAAFARLLEARQAEGRRRLGPGAFDVVRAYLDWHQGQGSKPDTVLTHKWHLFRWCEFRGGDGIAYGDRSAGSFEVKDWTRFRKDMEGKGAQTGYVRLAYSSVHSCWRWASRPVEDREPERLIAANPFAELKRPRKGRGRRGVLPWATVEAMAAFVTEWAGRPAEGVRNRKVAVNRQRAGNRLKALACRLVIESGCRPKEAASLRWDWVHEARRVVEIPEDHVKTGEDRFIALRPGTANVLAELRAGGVCHPTWVFVPAGDDRTEPMDAHRLAEWFGRARAAARREGIDLPEGTSLYTFRHSLVTLAREAGVDLRYIAPAMGHDAKTAEETYSHLGGTHVVGVMDDVWDRIRRKAERDGDKHGGL